MKVRNATLADCHYILEQLKIFSSTYETKLNLFPSDECVAMSKIKLLIEGHVVLVSENDRGETTGFIAGFLSKHYFNEDIMTLTELFWWVEERHRGSRAGLMLYDKFIEIGRELSDWIILCLKFGSPVKKEFFLKRNFKQLDESFLLEVN